MRRKGFVMTVKNVCVKIMAIVLLIIAAVSFCGCSSEGADAAEFYTENIEMPAEIAVEETEITVEEISVPEKLNGFTTDERVTYAAVSTANEQLEMLPDNVWKSFCRNGWELRLTGASLNVSGDTYSEGSVMGYCDSYNKVIELSAVSTAYIQSSLLHEFGHFIYRQSGSETWKEFEGIFEKDMKAGGITGYNSHCTSGASEYFAESVKRYLRGQSVSEDAAAFIEKTIRAM